ncbi:MAG: M23 family metallopeptidase [Pseudomonadota bacterium]
MNFTGDFIQGGLVYGQAAPGSDIKINTNEVRVTPQGEFILGFGRDYPETTVITITQADGSSAKRTLKIAQRDYKIQRIDGLPNEQVHPSEKTLVRINKERESITKARSLNDDRVDFKDGFIWPAQGPITGVYGSQRILNGEPRQPHFGIDVAAPVGTAVVAPASGLVTYAEDMYFSGYTLVIDHGHNLSSSFLHLNKILVQVGNYVQQGEEIAHVGASGRVTGPHLDWRMNWQDQRIDPGLLMDDQSNTR